MIRLSMCVVAALLVWGTPARALAYDCPTVRAYVTQYGFKAAHRWARAQGYTIFEIAMVKAACFRR